VTRCVDIYRRHKKQTNSCPMKTEKLNIYSAFNCPSMHSEWASRFLTTHQHN